MTPDGFEVPIHKALTQPIMIAGVPRELAILNGTLMAALVLGLQSYETVPLGVLIHLGARRLAMADPDFLKVFRRQTKHNRYYES